MKYIIEFEDEPSMFEAGLRYYQCKQVPYWGLSHEIIKNLTPYTEPDCKAIEDEVWKMARLIFLEADDGGLKSTDLYECYKSSNIQKIMKTHSYQEVKAKYDEWRKKKDEIHVGDEVEQITASGSPTGTKCIVVKIDGDKMNGIGKDGSLVVCSSQVKRWWTKTGRHFDEIEEVLKKMRDTDD